MSNRIVLYKPRLWFTLLGVLLVAGGIGITNSAEVGAGLKHIAYFVLGMVTCTVIMQFAYMFGKDLDDVISEKAE